MALITSWRAAGTLRKGLLEFLRRRCPLGQPLEHAKYCKHKIRQLGFLVPVARSGTAAYVFNTSEVLNCVTIEQASAATTGKTVADIGAKY